MNINKRYYYKSNKYTFKVTNECKNIIKLIFSTCLKDKEGSIKMLEIFIIYIYPQQISKNTHLKFSSI